MIILLGLIDILAGFFFIFDFIPSLSMALASILLLKGLYTAAMTGNLFDFFGIIDLAASGLYFLRIMGMDFGIIFNIVCVVLLLKGLSSFIKL